jgi:hypothetical protein
VKTPFLPILWRPADAWGAVAAARPGWRRSLFGHAAPLALVPALAWPIGHAVDPIGPDVATRSFPVSFVATFLMCLAAVALVAAVIHALAPVFEVRRQWDAAMAVSALSATPVLLASPFLASAALTILVVVALFHSCFLCGLGVRRLLGCASEDAAMYVAAVVVAASLAGFLLGGLSSAAGIL